MSPSCPYFVSLIRFPYVDMMRARRLVGTRYDTSCYELGSDGIARCMKDYRLNWLFTSCIHDYTSKVRLHILVYTDAILSEESPVLLQTSAPSPHR